MIVFYSFIYLLNSWSFYFLIIIYLAMQGSMWDLIFFSMKMGGVSAQSCPTLWKTTDCSLPGHSAHGILQARTLEWVAIPFSRGSSQPRDQTWISHIACRFFTGWDTLIPWSGIKRSPLHWECEFLTTAPPEKSLG